MRTPAVSRMFSMLLNSLAFVYHNRVRKDILRLELNDP